jgi:hypothetical protein
MCIWQNKPSEMVDANEIGQQIERDRIKNVNQLVKNLLRSKKNIDNGVTCMIYLRYQD